MCSHLLKMMENYQGDLADIVRATTAIDGAATPTPQASTAAALPDWQFSRNSINYTPEYFGYPFTYIRDPLTSNIDSPPASELFYNSSIVNGGAANNSRRGVINPDDQMKRPSNIFSRMLQISPNAKLQHQPCDSGEAAPPHRGLKNPSILVSNNGGLISPSSSTLQISSPRNTGIKRRKSQAKRVVCIPAPAPANSRATGEVVPSDLWAWRKYGQKPIKGSPYPRGYYRCSSSKGCSARKQVERSRTDPNMLVITYTSEHNHPWPTQRNALAGSTRSQTAKNSCTSNKDSDQTEKPTTNPKHHEHKETSSPVEDNCRAVKEEIDLQFEPDLDEGFPATYKPALADSSSSYEQDSFFADLGEIGEDPLNLLGQGFPARDNNNNHTDLDPFSFYDWATTTTNAAAAATVEESGRKS